MKRILAMLLAAMLVLSMGVVAFADGETEVATFADFKSAYASAAAGTTIKMTADITINENIEITGKAVTLNMNAKNLVIAEGVTLTIGYKDSASPIVIASGTIQVNGTLNANTLPYGENGLVASQGGKISVGANGKAILPEDWANAGLTPTNSTVISENIPNGAQIAFGENELWVCANNTWFETSEAVAAIGETGYATVEAAISAANENDTVTLIANATLSENLTIDKKITLQMAKYTLTIPKDITLTITEKPLVYVTANLFINGVLDAKALPYGNVNGSGLVKSQNGDIVVSNTGKAILLSSWEDLVDPNTSPVVSANCEDGAIIIFGESDKWVRTNGKWVEISETAPKPEVKPDPCDHDFDANGKCKDCGIIVIDHTANNTVTEANPNTGAESAVAVVAAVAALALAGAVASKK